LPDRRLIARKFDGSKPRSYPVRPPVDAAIKALIVRMAQENFEWGYDRIASALSNLGHHVRHPAYSAAFAPAAP
jgi:hypothetical protein